MLDLQFTLSVACVSSVGNVVVSGQAALVGIHYTVAVISRAGKLLKAACILIESHVADVNLAMVNQTKRAIVQLETQV